MLTVVQAPAQFINVLQSPLMKLVVQASPFSFQVIELSSGAVLLQQTTNQFTIGSTYTVSSATNFVITPTTMDADLILFRNFSHRPYHVQLYSAGDSSNYFVQQQ